MIPHNLPTLGSLEHAAAARVLESNWIAQGPEVEAFENELCAYLDLPIGHAVAVSSGSAALFLGLWALDGRNKSIGLPVYSCTALSNAVGLVGGRCVYLDSAESNPNVDISAATRIGIDILIAPSLFGVPVDLPEVRSFKVIEDIAQSLGAICSGKKIGLRGEVGVCSFYATKLITSGGQGGAVVSRDKGLIDKIRDYRQFDGREDRSFRFNFQMTDLQAAVGRVQLGRLPFFLERRNKWFEMYSDSGLKLLDGSDRSIRPVRYRIVLKSDQPLKVISSLESAGIRAIVPIEEWELLDKPEHYPAALAWATSTVSLPAYPTLTEEAVERIMRITCEAA
jgi:perosamine synthetase